MTTFRTSAPRRPYDHMRKPQRETDRRRMHGDLQPANDNGDRSRLWFWIQFAIYAACTAYALKLWVVK